MASEEKMRELIEELWESDAACALTNRAARALEAALHSVEAEKEPVNLPPAKPDLDPVEAHKRGEFVSDVEAAYNEGWNDCRHAAMYQTEKEPE